MDDEGTLAVITELEGELTEPVAQKEASTEDAPAVEADAPEPDTSKVQEEVAETLEQSKPAESTEQESMPEPESPAQAGDHEEPQKEQQQEPKSEEKTLVANMAGESVLEADVAKTSDDNDVEPLEVKDEVKP
jgi:DNA-binding protein H-NS